MDAYMHALIADGMGGHTMLVAHVGVRDGRAVFRGFGGPLPRSVRSVYWCYGDDTSPDDHTYHCECAGHVQEHCPLHSADEVARINAELAKADDRSLPQE